MENLSKTVEKKIEKKVIVIARMDNTIDHTFESANRIYDSKACCSTIPTCGGGNLEPKVIRRWKKNI